MRIREVPVEAGIYRLNKVKPTRPGTRTIECAPDDEIDLLEIYVDYDEKYPGKESYQPARRDRFHHWDGFGNGSELPSLLLCQRMTHFCCRHVISSLA